MLKKFGGGEEEWQVRSTQLLALLTQKGHLKGLVKKGLIGTPTKKKKKKGKTAKIFLQEVEEEAGAEVEGDDLADAEAKSKAKRRQTVFQLDSGGSDDGDDDDEETKIEVWSTLALYTKDGALEIVTKHRATTDGEKAWKERVDKYEKSGAARVTNLWGELMRASMGATEDPDTFFGRVERLQRQLGVCGKKVEGDVLTSIALNVVPSSCATLKAALTTAHLKGQLTYPDVKINVRSHYLSGVKKGRRAHGDKQKRPGGAESAHAVTKGPCHTCGVYGHYKYQCPNKTSGGQQDGNGGKGNGKPWIRPGGRGGGSKPSDGKTPDVPKKPVFKKPFCTFCDIEGHDVTVCRATKAAKKEWAKVADSGSDGGGDNSSEGGESSSFCHEDLFAKMSGVSQGCHVVAQLPKGVVPGPDWIVDSGGTSHAVPPAEGVLDVVECQEDFTLGGGGILKATGVGRVQVLVPTSDGSRVPMELRRVLIVPGLTRKILSVRSIDRAGGAVVFAQGGGFIKIHNHCFPFSGEEGLYEIGIRTREPGATDGPVGPNRGGKSPKKPRTRRPRKPRPRRVPKPVGASGGSAQVAAAAVGAKAKSSTSVPRSRGGDRGASPGGTPGGDGWTLVGKNGKPVRAGAGGGAGTNRVVKVGRGPT